MNRKQTQQPPSPPAPGSAFRELTADDVVAAENKGYDHGRRHGYEECMEEMRRLRDAAWSIIIHRHTAEDWLWQNVANAVNDFDAKAQRVNAPNNSVTGAGGVP